MTELSDNDADLPDNKIKLPDSNEDESPQSVSLIVPYIN